MTKTSTPLALVLSALAMLALWVPTVSTPTAALTASAPLSNLA